MRIGCAGRAQSATGRARILRRGSLRGVELRLGVRCWELGMGNWL